MSTPYPPLICAYNMRWIITELSEAIECMADKPGTYLAAAKLKTVRQYLLDRALTDVRCETIEKIEEPSDV